MVVDLELQRGAWAMGKKAQTAFFQATLSATHGSNVANDGTTEDGLYMPNSFYGVRLMLSTNANNVIPGFYPTSGGFTPNVLDAAAPTSTVVNPITIALQKIAQQIMDYGGNPDVIVASPRAAAKLALEGGNLIRYSVGDATGAGLILGQHVRAIDTVAGEIPVVVIPGNSIGTYTPASGTWQGDLAEDIYVFDRSTISFPFLGSPVPTTIQIPVGFDRTLVHRYIIFWMFGLAMKVPVFNGKVRVSVP